VFDTGLGDPIPVSVMLLPVVTGDRTGLLVVRRSIEPRLGKLALVGGFLEEQETWAEGAVREVREETGVVISPNTLAPFWFTSTEPRPNRVLLFSTAQPVASASNLVRYHGCLAPHASIRVYVVKDGRGPPPSQDRARSDGCEPQPRRGLARPLRSAARLSARPDFDGRS